MSQLADSSLHHSDQQPHPDKISAPERPIVTSLQAKIIEYTSPKNKKEVIEIQDSDNEQPPLHNPTTPKQRKFNPDQRKPKRTPIRCQLCKQSGKKVNMKCCIDCKAYFHINCLEQQGELTSRYRCRKCRHKREGDVSVIAKKHDKNQKTGDDKMAGRRLQKQKRREEQLKKMGCFQQRYPYYFQEDRIRFPIEDKLLFIYRELFQITESPRIRPRPHPLIPSPILADFLQMENFFSTFRQQLKGYGTMPTQIRKDIFYLSLGSDGLDSIFCSLLECLLKVYLSDIFDKNKTDNVRILNDHSFFTLLTHLNDNDELGQQVVVRTASEIIRYLATVPSMRRAFDSVKYPQLHNLQTKTSLLVNLIRGLSQIDEFHTLVSIKSQKMQQLTKEKTELIAQLKIDQAQNLSNNQKLKDMALAGRELQQSIDGVTRIMTKELDKHRKKIQKLTTEQTKSQETIKQIRNKINQIGRTMPFLTTQVNFLGLDRNNSEYFFFVREPNRLYVKFRSYLLHTNQDFMIYEGRDVIIEVTKQLNTKGLLEKHLYDNITSFIKDDIINDNVGEQPSNFILEENKFHPIYFQQILEMVRQTEDTFSTYLTLRECQWAPPVTREIFMQQFLAIDDLQILKEQLRSLQENFLFAEYSNSQVFDKREDESQEELRDGREGRKKIPIRIWGINSEKTKKYWLQYLQESIDIIGIWLCAFIFKNNVQKYVKKKMEAYYDQQMKEQKYRTEEGRERGRPPLIKHSDRQTDRRVNNKPPSTFEESQQTPDLKRPNLRKRKQKKMNIESQEDYDEEPDEEEVDQQQSQESSNEQCCEQCGEYGEMLCCDTCPKVYHRQCLKMVDIPEGEWSCYKCLEKLSNQRQTRSRMKKMNRFV